MLNKKGMILLETLFFLLICIILAQLIVSYTNSQVHMGHIEKGGFQDEEIRSIQQP
ncbi:MAG: hypothetical protein RR690_04000 [Longicatena sp.]